MEALDGLAGVPTPSPSSLAEPMATPTSSAGGGITDKLISIQGPEVDPDSCELLGPFALIIQGIMGLIVLGSLLVKRQRERPRRKMKIWGADVSKQVIGQLFVHFLNLFISSHIASLPSGGNPCALYFINILVDTTFGVFLVYLFLRLVTYILEVSFAMPLAELGLVSGRYPPPYLLSWVRQLGVYLAALGLMKLSVVVLFWIGGAQLIRFGDGIIETITSDPKAQVLISVMIGPCILNVLQFLLIDSFIKMKGEDQGSPELLESDDDEEARHGFLSGGGGPSFADDDSDGEGATKPDEDDTPSKRRRSFHQSRPAPSNPNGVSMPAGGGGRGPSDDPAGLAHSYPPSSSSAAMDRTPSQTRRDGDKSGSKTDLAGEGEGWESEDDHWDAWGTEDEGAPVVTLVDEEQGTRPDVARLESDDGIPTALDARGAGVGAEKMVRWAVPPASKGVKWFAAADMEKADAARPTPTTPTIIISEAF